jgi:hypothetical protein
MSATIATSSDRMTVVARSRSKRLAVPYLIDTSVISELRKGARADRPRRAVRNIEKWSFLQRYEAASSIAVDLGQASVAMAACLTEPCRY